MKKIEIGKHLQRARASRSLSQRQLASNAGLHQSDVSKFEKEERIPTLEQLLRLASVLRVSLQWFLSGTNEPGDELADLAFQLEGLGIADLHVPNARVVGAFRPTEEVLAVLLVGNAPSARIIEAIPAVLAWNDWNPSLLSAFADRHDPRVRYRLGWLADIAITIHQGQGFPGGCPSLPFLETYIRTVKLPSEEDSLGYSKGVERCPPVSLRWKMGYPAQLELFHERAERLHALRADNMFRLLNMR